jgi:N-acetylmuramoyl-L-alanine amidase
MKLRLGAAILLLAFVFVPTVAAKAPAVSARALYMRTLEREHQLREKPTATVRQFRSVVNAYAAIVRRFPGSGYSDNALWQGGNLALLAFERFDEPADRRTGERMLKQLKEGYPHSSLVRRVDDVLRAVESPASPPAARASVADAAGSSDAAPDRAAATSGVAASAAAQPSAHTAPAVTIRDIKRAPIPEGMRVTIEMDAEATFRAERLDNPRRVFFDLKGTRPVPALLDATLRFDDEIVREIRLGRHPQATTRIVFDMAGVDSYSVFTLYSPYRLVIDFKPPTVAETKKPQPGTATPRTVASQPNSGTAVPTLPPAPLAVVNIRDEPAPEPPVKPLTPRPVASAAVIPPALPSANSDGKFSLSRQLGLGIARVVIDAGHGGHDPGAQSNGVSESELTLDVAARLGRLLEKQPGVDVVLTRDSDVYIPLEERTAIANREGADLFLSIHANASRNPKARGVETYFLNFASNPAAEAVAARENASSARAMHSLPDIVRAIALNNKIDESRDFAETVQRAMVRRLSARNAQLRDLGVKQAPFVVLIGAAMPSVLAEISFVTNKQEGQLLKSAAYRQHIAEALLDAVLRYQQSLKRPRAGVVGLGTR